MSDLGRKAHAIAAINADIERGKIRVKEIEVCGSCPFVDENEDEDETWQCDAGHNFSTGTAWDGYPRRLAVIYGAAPPDWCPLRSHSIAVRLTELSNHDKDEHGQPK